MLIYFIYSPHICGWRIHFLEMSLYAIQWHDYSCIYNSYQTRGGHKNFDRYLIRTWNLGLLAQSLLDEQICLTKSWPRTKLANEQVTEASENFVHFVQVFLAFDDVEKVFPGDSISSMCHEIYFCSFYRRSDKRFNQSYTEARQKFLDIFVLNMLFKCLWESYKQRVFIWVPGNKSCHIWKRASIKTFHDSLSFINMLYNLKFRLKGRLRLPLHFDSVNWMLKRKPKYHSCHAYHGWSKIKFHILWWSKFVFRILSFLLHFYIKILLVTINFAH